MGNNYRAHYKKTEVRKKMLLLLFAFAVGVFFDGATTMAGQSMNIKEYNSIVNAIGGLGNSLLIRVAVVLSLYLIINRLAKPKDIERVTKFLCVLVVLTWVVVILNCVVAFLVYAFIYA